MSAVGRPLRVVVGDLDPINRDLAERIYFDTSGFVTHNLICRPF